ncbi:Amino acid transporter, transmembrane domain [Cinara cedri]|uniref:Amino acid transporter, transmembrane domain n=1 Tax=Cinara cedri TaxID=506608 RepID=A0A5E4NJ01_9HEMI|nr:Amino acid transporter, transmembrane domain [Cinara cedri]
MSGASKTESIYSCSSRSFESNSVSKPSSAWSAAAFANSSSTLLYKCIGYDPFCHRNREHLYPSYLSIVFAVYRAVGLGFLCMPHAFQQVGAVVGLALCVFAGLTFGYSYTLLVSIAQVFLSRKAIARATSSCIRAHAHEPCRFRYKICQIHKVPTTVPHYSYQNLIEYSLALGPRVISSFSKFFKFLFVAMNLSLNFGVSCLYTKFVSTAFQEVLVCVYLLYYTADLTA